jgi:hypothetical protein
MYKTDEKHFAIGEKQPTLRMIWLQKPRRKPVYVIVMRRLSRPVPPPIPIPLLCCLCSSKNWPSAPPSWQKEKQWGRRSNSISKLHHRSINESTVCCTWQHRYKPCMRIIPSEISVVYAYTHTVHYTLWDFCGLRLYPVLQYSQVLTCYEEQYRSQIRRKHINVFGQRRLKSFAPQPLVSTYKFSYETPLYGKNWIRIIVPHMPVTVSQMASARYSILKPPKSVSAGSLTPLKPDMK